MSAYLYNVVRRPKGGFQELIGDNPDFREAFSDTTVAPAARWLQFNYIDGRRRVSLLDGCGTYCMIKSWGTGAPSWSSVAGQSASGEMTWTCRRCLESATNGPGSVLRDLGHLSWNTQRSTTCNMYIPNNVSLDMIHVMPAAWLWKEYAFLEEKILRPFYQDWLILSFRREDTGLKFWVAVIEADVLTYVCVWTNELSGQFVRNVSWTPNGQDADLFALVDTAVLRMAA
jgi:hypothetical protein